MTAEQHVKMMMGEMMAQQAVLMARLDSTVEELNAVKAMLPKTSDPEKERAEAAAKA